MKTNNFTKFTLAVSLSVSVVACTGINNNLSNQNKIVQHDVKKDKVLKNNGTIILNLAEIFKTSKDAFSVKRYTFDAAEVEKLNVTVYSVDDSNTLVEESKKEFVKADGLTNVYLSVSPGNKVISVETKDNKGFSLSKLMAASAISSGTNTTLRINYGTFPAASVMKKLMDDTSATVRGYARTVDLKKLDSLVNDLTGYDVNTNTYGGINPAFIDVDQIVSFIKSPPVTVPVTPAGTVPVYRTSRTDNAEIQKTNRFRCSQVPALETCLDKEIKGKLRVTVRNNLGVILKNARITINDLTAVNVTSTIDDTTLIENISQGTWTLRITVSDNGKDLYQEFPITINAPNMDQTINSVPNTMVVSSIDFENPVKKDDNFIPSSFVLNVGSNMLLTAKVKMSDGTINQNVTWTSNNSGVASVGNGSITGVAPGSTTITAAATDNLAVTKSVTINVFKKDADGPAITSFSPVSSSAGAIVTITGTNFDNSTLVATQVAFNGVLATITDVSKTEIKAIVPAGATTGKVYVSTNKGTIVSNDFFIINSPANTDGMVFIPGDEFNMGSDGNANDDFNPKHKVKLNSFHIDRTEVTNEQYALFIQAGGYTNYATNGFWSNEGKQFLIDNKLGDSNARPASWFDTRFNQPKQPVVGISWYESEAYAKSLGRRLPTEAEWEFSSRGTDERSFPWGSDAPSESNQKANGYFGSVGKGDGYQFSANVGSYSTNSDSPYGLRDMSGNAAEWVNDWYNQKYYTNSPLDNPKGPSVGGTKVLRGGSWYNHSYFGNDAGKLLNSLRTFSRFYSSPANRSNYIGFRTAK